MVRNNYGVIKNCYVTGTVGSTTASAGGIASTNGNTYGIGAIIENCYFAGTITATGTMVANAGGITATNEGGTIERCYTTGSVTQSAGSSSSGAGGIVGYSRDYTSGYTVNGVIRDCYSTSNVSSTTHFAGGIGAQISSSITENCYATGTVNGSQGSGGIGAGASGEIKNCVALAQSVTGGSRGRIVSSSSGTLTKNYARADMPGFSVTPDPNGATGADFNINDLLSGVFNAVNGWRTEVWDIPAVNLAAGNALPTLKNMPGVSQNPTLP